STCESQSTVLQSAVRRCTMGGQDPLLRSMRGGTAPVHDQPQALPASSPPSTDKPAARVYQSPCQHTSRTTPRPDMSALIRESTDRIGQSLSMELPAELISVGAARRETARALQEWCVDECDADT